jgi:hypothetical protein
MTAAREERTPLPSAGEIDERIKQRLAEFDEQREQRRRNQQNGSTAPDAPETGGGR